MMNNFKNHIIIDLEKKSMRLQFNNYTLRLKKIYKTKGTQEQWNEMKTVWKKIIDLYKEKGII